MLHVHIGAREKETDALDAGIPCAVIPELENTLQVLCGGVLSP
jgi:hypothetical protein